MTAYVDWHKSLKASKTEIMVLGDEECFDFEDSSTSLTM